MLADVSVADFTSFGQFSVFCFMLYGFWIYISGRDKNDALARKEFINQYENLVNKVDNTIRDTTTKFDTTVREFKAETRDLVDSSMALTEKSVEAIVGFRGGLDEVRGLVRDLKNQFDDFRQSKQAPNGGQV